MNSRCVLSLAAVMLLPLSARAAETLWTEVTVRVYDSTGATEAERRSALRIASSIVSVAAVELNWRSCSEPAGPETAAAAQRHDPCQAPLASGELALRIVRSHGVSDDLRELPLGDAMINARTGAGVLATIYIDRVDWLAAHTGIDSRALLGRAIAHELGHLLMATSAHGTNGLMRPVWSQSEIRRRQIDDWIFRPREIAAIKARAYARQSRAARMPLTCSRRDLTWPIRSTPPLPRHARRSGCCASRSCLRGRRTRRAADADPPSASSRTSTAWSRYPGRQRVIDQSILSAATGVNRSVSFIFGEPFRYAERGSKPVVSTTSVLPSK